MNFRLTAILFSVVFVIGVILLILSFRTDDKNTSTDALAREFAAAGLKADAVDTIEFERPDGSTLLIVRTDKERNSWQIQKPITAEANAAQVLPIINAFLTAKPTPYTELSSNPAVHGLDPPSLKVTLRQGTERSSTINLGDVTLGDKGVVFVTTSSQSKRPMAVRRADLEPLFREGETGSGTAGAMAKWTGDFRTRNIFPGDSRAMGEDVASIKLSLPNKKQELALARSPSGGWKFTTPAGWGDADTEGDSTGTPNTFTGVNPLLRTLTNMSVATPVDFIDNPNELKEYGLNPDNPDLIRVEMKTKDGKTAVVYIGKMEAPPPAADPKSPFPPMGGKVFVKIEGQPGVIRSLASPQLANLATVIADPSPLRDRNLITVDARKQIDGIDIVLAGQPADRPTKLRRVPSPDPRVPGEWKLFGGPNDPQTASTTAVQKVLDVVQAQRAIKGFPAPNPANFAAISATLFVWVDGFNPPIAPKAEPAKRGEPVKLEFGRKEGDTVYVRRTLPGGQVNEFALPARLPVALGTETVDVLAAVTKSRLDFLDPSLPTFSDAAVVRISVSGANTYVLAKDEMPDASTKEAVWRFASPEPQKGRVADSGAVKDLLSLLANAQSVFGRFVDESPTPEKLVEYGLSPPRLKVVVGLGLDPQGAAERGFEFGKDTSDPDKVYARVVGQPAVFTIQRRVMDRFANPDLRDKMIFRDVPVSQVNEVELTGWGGITLKFQKNKDGAWTAAPPTPPTFMVDPAKVNAFLTLLNRTRVKDFEKGTPEAKHGFGDPKQNLQVVLKWPGGAISLNIGATPDAGATYYGSSAWLDQKNPVFTIEAAPFKLFKDGPTGFAK